MRIDSKGRFIKGHSMTEAEYSKWYPLNKMASEKRIGKKVPSLTNEKNFKWKGDKVGMAALHSWVIRRLGTPMKCSECGIDGLPKGKKDTLNGQI